MKDGLHVVTARGCPHCKTFKERHKEDMGRIDEIVIDDAKNDDDVWVVIEKLKIEGTPTVFEKKGDKVCELQLDDLESEVQCASLSKKKPRRKISNNSSVVDLILNNVGGKLYG